MASLTALTDRAGGDGASSSGLTKVVLARRSDVLFRGHLDPLVLLETLQERDPRAYQVTSAAC